jgi:hypothetical protein
MNRLSTERPRSCQSWEQSLRNQGLVALEEGCLPIIVRKFGVSSRWRAREIIGSRTEPDKIAVLVRDQAVAKSSRDRGGARGGATVGKPR